MAEAQEVLYALTIATKSSEKNDKNSCSVADEIMKYKNLLDIGTITQEEYEAKKKQLLNM